jgi:hypothetical protein
VFLGDGLMHAGHVDRAFPAIVHVLHFRGDCGEAMAPGSRASPINTHNTLSPHTTVRRRPRDYEMRPSRTSSVSLFEPAGEEIR